jgi:cobalt-zinc-cadmium efflux system membrane fusion protein
MRHTHKALVGVQTALVVFLLATVSCSGESKEIKETKTAVSPGKICEHGIQEAICTKCNPGLIAVFRAKGNFCEEHGFPESACPICHPEKKGQIVVENTTKKPEAPAPPEDGTKVRLKTKETARLAGIMTVQASESPNNAVLSTTATITYDATKYAQINARASGVIRELKVDIGSPINAKDALAVIQSASVGADRSKVKGASAALATAKENYRRTKELVEQGLTAQRDLLAAQANLDAAQAEYNSSTAALGEIDKGAQFVGGYSLTTPIAGVVVQRNATLGKFVDTDEILFEVADTSSMWVELDIPELDVHMVSVNQEIAVSVDGLPGRQFKGKISYLSPAVDRQTRTVKARASLENPDGTLRANMFATALILGETRNAVVIPRGAVQNTRGVNLVFVKLAEDVYEARYVTLLEDDGSGDLVSISKGVTSGEEVVTDGSFLLKTETLKESIGAGCCADD